LLGFESRQAKLVEEASKDVIMLANQNILIDCHWRMFQQHLTGNSSSNIEPFDAALCVINELLKLRIQHVATEKSGKRDDVGVLFFGTRPQRFTKKTTYNWMPPRTAQVLHLVKYLLPQQQQ